MNILYARDRLEHALCDGVAGCVTTLSPNL